MRIALPVNGRDLDPRWGKAHGVVVTEVDHGEVSPWELHKVEWGRLHDEGSHETHHVRIVHFLIANKVGAVMIDCTGQSTPNTVVRMGFRVITGQTGSVRQTALRMVALQP